MIPHCSLITEETREFAKTLNLDTEYVHSLVMSWQTAQGELRMPSLEEIKEYIKEDKRIAEREYFDFPQYTFVNRKENQKLVTEKDGVYNVSIIPSLDYFFNAFINAPQIDDMRKTITSLGDAYGFLLWCKRSQLENNYTLKDSGEIIQSALKRLQAFKRTYNKSPFVVKGETKTSSSKNNEIILTNEQQEVVDSVVDFVSERVFEGNGDPNVPFITIKGMAGTGKTTIINEVLKQLRKRSKYLQVAIAAKSRKAVKVLYDKTVKDNPTIARETLYTLAGADPNKSENQFDINPKNSKIEQYSIIFVDEASMVGDNMFDAFKDYLQHNPRTAIVFLGDYGQIKPFGDEKNKSNEQKVLEKSKVFNPQYSKIVELTERIRQGEDSPILSYADDIYDIAVRKKGGDVGRFAEGETVITDKGAIIFDSIKNPDTTNKIFEMFKRGLSTKNTDHVKIVAGRNETVNKWNTIIHNTLFPNSPNKMCVGDSVILNSPYNVNHDPKRTLYNATEGVIEKISEEKTVLLGDESIKYQTYSVRTEEGNVVPIDVFVDDGFMKPNYVAYHRALSKALKEAQADKRNWPNYYRIKGYFADLELGYAITADKSQGSTYDMVVVDYSDIMSVSLWNNENKAEHLYTGLTRARNTVIVLNNNSTNEIKSYEKVNSSIENSKQGNIVDGVQTIEEVQRETHTKAPSKLSGTVSYLKVGQTTPQTYTVQDGHIYNKEGKEVYSTPSTDRNKILAKLEVQQGTAVVVNYRGRQYIVNKDNQITSVTTGNIMQWGEENGDRKAILSLAEERRASTLEQEPLSTYVNHSGGAVGSDSYWGEIGKRYGVTSNHYYHGQKTPNGNVAITEEVFEEGKQHVMKANETLNRRPERYMDLLARNWIQVKNADAIFAIGHLKNGIVDGGTGWAVQMAIDAGKPVYVFDQERNQWYKNIDLKWSESEIPTLTPNFAGIGTREINDTGKKAIRDIYEKSFQQISQPQSSTTLQSANLNNAIDNANDVERFAGVEESEQTISSNKTILSNEELAYWNKQGVDSMPRILVASERTDPAFHTEEILDTINGKRKVHQWGVVDGRRTVVGLVTGHDFAGLYLVTKHDGLPMLKLLQTKIPKLIHFSITTLGGTKYEPGVMKYNDLLDKIQDYIKQGLDPEAVTIRIDPIVPGVTQFSDIENVIKRASEMGIKRIRFSIMDAYANTRQSMSKLGYDFSKYYGDENFAKDAKDEYIKEIADFMLSMKDKYDITLGTCAEKLARAGISKEGCLSVSAVNKMLGTSIEDKGTENNGQRKLCSCYGGKIDALAYNKNCASHCIYCYAKHENDKALEYYDENGNLKDNEFTQTRFPRTGLETSNPSITDELIAHLEEMGIKVHTRDELIAYLNKHGLTSVQEAIDNIQNTQEINEIRERAIADGQIILNSDGSFNYALAPNGKKSNLTERQWLQVRTKNFIRWFGNWEKVAYSSKFRKSNDIPNSITSATYQGITVGKAEFNPDMAPDGGTRIIYLNGKPIGEIPIFEYDDSIRMGGSIGAATEIEEEYRGKGYGKKAHIALANIAKSEGKVLYSDSSNSDAEDALWKSLVREGIAEVVSEKPKIGHWNHTTYRIVNDNLPQAEDIDSGDRDVSKVVDENGEPLVVYHGSDYKDDATKKGDWSQNALPYATYFAPYKYANNEFYYAAFLNIKNPVYEHPDISEDAIQDENNFKKYVLDGGHDGIIANYDKDTNAYKAKEIVVIQPNQIKSATNNNGMFSTENDDIQMFIGKKARNQFEQQLMKARPDLATPEYTVDGINFIKDPFSDDFIPNRLNAEIAQRLQKDGIIKKGEFASWALTDKGKEMAQVSHQRIDAILDFLHSLEDNKENAAYIKTAIKWIANKSLNLPQDHTKAYQAFELARKKHLDLQKYSTLGELIASPEMQPKEKDKAPFNPDKAKTFSNKRTVTTKGGRVFTVYDVENTEEGQREVCKALAAHYEMSPWCLSTFTATGEPTQSAKNYWDYYNALPRKIAYENGKPVAFNSLEKRNVYRSIRSIPISTNEFGRLTIAPIHARGETFEALYDEGLIEKSDYSNSYLLTSEGLKEVSIKETEEAWWDMEDTHPQDSLNDSIVSEPKKLHTDPTIPTIAEYTAMAEDVRRVLEQREQREAEDSEYELPFFITPQGEVYGFVDEKGDIYLDETVITAEHPIHEFTHLWDRMVSEKRPELWKRGVKLMKAVDNGNLWKSIANNPAYGQKWEASEGMTPERLEFLIASEVHARLVGEKGKDIIDEIEKKNKKEKGIIARLKDWMLDVWKSLKQTFGTWTEEDYKVFEGDVNKALEYFNNLTLRDFAYGQTGQDIEDEEVLNEVPKPNIEKDIHVEIMNARRKANMTFTPQIKMYRINSIAKAFSQAIDAYLNRETEKAVDNCRVYQQELTDLLKKGGSRLEIQEAQENLQTSQQRLKDLQDPTNNRKAVVQMVGVKTLLEETRTIFEQYKADAEKSDKAELAKKLNDVLENWDILIKDSLSTIEYRENVRIVLTYDNNITKYDVADETRDEQQRNDDENFDDETGNRANGNDGWGAKARLTDPHSSTSKEVKKLLSTLPLRDENGKPVRDDIGDRVNLNERFAHDVLLSELNSISRCEEYAFKDEQGNWQFPAFERMANDPAYKWVRSVINKLRKKPELISLFYHDLRLDFINYCMISDGKRAELNHESVVDSAMSFLIRNVELGQPVSTQEHSLYGTDGNASQKAAKEAKELWKSIDEAIERPDNLDSQSEIAKKLKDLFSRVGFSVSQTHFFNTLQKFETEGYESEDIKELKDALEQVAYILDDIIKGKGKKDDTYIGRFNNNLERIAKNIMSITEDGLVQSFKLGDDLLWSYSTPNYVDTMVKRLGERNEKKFNDYVEKEYGYDRLFKKDGEWKNEWLRILSESEIARKNIEVKELKAIRDEAGDLITYADWEPSQIAATFMEMYYSGGQNYGYYNLPILSDSTVAKFIKFKKYAGFDFKEQLLPLYRQVVWQELDRITRIEEREKLNEKIKEINEENKRRAKEGLDEIPLMSEIAAYDKGGKQFFFFPELNDNDGEFLKHIQKLKEQGKTTEVDAFIDETMKKILDNMVEATIAEHGDALSYSITKMIENGVIKNTENSIADEQGNLREGALNNIVEEFIWNNTFASTQIIQLLVSDPAFYKDDVDFQKRFKEVYASGHKLFTGSKYGRKTERTVYIKDHIIKTAMRQDLEKVLNKAVEEKRLQSYDVENILRKYDEVNAGDAQAYRSLSSYRAVLDMAGKWTPQMEEAMNRLAKGKFDMADYNLVWQTIKPFVYTTQKIPDGLGGYIRVPHQNKNSEFLLLTIYQTMAASIGEDSVLKGLNQWMEDNEIDVVQFESAVKSGKQGIVSLNECNTAADVIAVLDRHTKFAKSEEQLIKEGRYGTKEDGSEYKVGDFKPTVVHEFDYEDYVIQLPAHESLFDTIAVFGSQFRNLIVSDISDSKDIKFKIGDKEYTKQQLIDLYNSLIIENLLEDFSEVSGDFKDIESLQKLLLKSIENNDNYSRDLIEALEIVEVTDPRTNKTKKVFKIPLSHPTTTLKLQQLVNSAFKNAVTKQSIKGGACILVSNVGFTKELQIVRGENGEILGMECYLPAYSRDFFSAFMTTKKTDKGEEYQEFDIEKMKKEAPELLQAIGYRIPTEDKYSMVPLIIKGFLPQQNGSAIMLPAELTVIAGSDFDVDKLFLMLPEHRVDKQYDMKEAWKEFYQEHKDIVDKIEDAKWRTFQSYYEQVLKENPEDAEDIDITDKKQRDWLIRELKKQKGFKDYELIDDDIKVIDEFRKWFNKNKKKFVSGVKIRKIKYNQNKSPEEQSKAARNNMLIDISRAILTHPDTAEKLYNPGSFDEIKVGARGTTILNDRDLLIEYGKSHGLIKENENVSLETIKKISESIRALMKENKLDELGEILKGKKVRHSPAYLNSFIYFHQQNMVGAKLIGIYANGTTTQAKYQETALAVSEEYKFRIQEGNQIYQVDSLTRMYGMGGKRISKNCANFSAASVDNVKDPVLAKILQNTDTAEYAIAMLKMGLDINTISMLFSTPFVKDIVKSGNYLSWSYKSIAADLAKRKKQLIQNPTISTEDLSLYLTIAGMNGGSLSFDGARGSKIAANSSTETTVECTKFVDEFETKLLSVLANIAAVKENLSELTRGSRADSPNGAMSTTLGGVERQLNLVEAIQKKGSHQKQGTSTYGLSGINETYIDNSCTKDQSISELRRKFRESKLPRLQAFYTLGIHLPSQIVKPYFEQYGTAIQEIIRRAGFNTPYGVISEDIANDMLKSYTTFALMQTELFGNDSQHTYEQKRNTYLKVYPETFKKILEENPILDENGTRLLDLAAFRKISVKNGEIVFDRAGRITNYLKEMYSRDFESLLYMSKDISKKIAYHLFMYSFYNNGLSYGHNAISQFFNPNFLSAFPAYIEGLRNIGQMSDEMTERFFYQYMYQNFDQKGFVPNARDLQYDQSIKKYTIKETSVRSEVTNEPYEFIKTTDMTGETHLYKVVKQNGKPLIVGADSRSESVVYEEVDTSTGNAEYNPNISAEDLIRRKKKRQQAKSNESKSGMTSRAAFEAIFAKAKAIENGTAFQEDNSNPDNKTSNDANSRDNNIEIETIPDERPLDEDPRLTTGAELEAVFAKAASTESSTSTNENNEKEPKLTTRAEWEAIFKKAQETDNDQIQLFITPKKESSDDDFSEEEGQEALGQTLCK